MKVANKKPFDEQSITGDEHVWFFHSSLLVKMEEQIKIAVSWPGTKKAI
jgi:hypothetical protein